MEFNKAKNLGEKKIWRFLNNYFNTNQPYPDIEILIPTKKTWAYLMKNCVFNQRNHYEKEIEGWTDKNHIDAVAFQKNGSFLEHDYYILLQRNPETGMSKFFDSKEYYVFRLFHELIHVLEYVTNKQLFTKKGQDQILYELFKNE